MLYLYLSLAEELSQFSQKILEKLFSIRLDKFVKTFELLISNIYNSQDEFHSDHSTALS